MNPDQTVPLQPTPASDESKSPQGLREYNAAELLHGEREVLIRHGDEVYRLCLTRNNKLILQK